MMGRNRPMLMRIPARHGETLSATTLHLPMPRCGGIGGNEDSRYRRCRVMDFSHQLNAYVARVEAGLDRHLPPAKTRPERLHTAMRYSLQAGGKRLRPVLVLA